MTTTKDTKSTKPGRSKFSLSEIDFADLHRRAELSQKSNARYLESLAAAEHPQSLGQSLTSFCQAVEFQGRRVRALQPMANEDGALLAAVIRGEFNLKGFRNRDLRPLLFETTETTDQEAKRQTAKIARMIRLLRAHGIVQKVTKTHRYQLTTAGRRAITALLAAKQASTEKLNAMAA